MANLIERYIYDVVRRLPEKERDEVRRELIAHIYDMLSDAPDEAEIRETLNKLGSPSILAGQYRQSPGYLISPAVYSDYIRVLKWVLPLVACILFALGIFLAGFDAIKGEITDVSELISGVLSNGISMCIEGALQALFWITLGFVIAERTTKPDELIGSKWTVEQLPEDIADSKNRIPLSDSIVELVLTALFSLLFIMMCLRILPFSFVIVSGDIKIYQLFSDSFLSACIPAVIITSVLGICECLVKIAKRRWAPLVCGTVVASNLVSIGAVFFIIARPEIFSAEFTAFAQSQSWGQIKIFNFLGNSWGDSVIFIFVAIVVVSALASSGHAIYRTVKAHIAE